MSLNTPSIENNKNSKKKYIWGAIIVIFVALCVVGINQYLNNNKTFNLNVTKADQYFKIEKFDDARQYYQIALDYRGSVRIENKIEICKKLESSKSIFDTGSTLFNKKEYVKAVDSYKKVIIEDEKRFNLNLRIKLRKALNYIVMKNFHKQKI